MLSVDTEFEAPPGFHPALFEDDLDDSQQSMSYPHIELSSARSKGKSKQIWLVKVPQGLHPADLDGLSFPVASSSNSSSSVPLTFLAGPEKTAYEVRVASKDKDGSTEEGAEELAGARILLPHSAKGHGRMSFAPKEPSRFLTITLAPPAGAASSFPDTANEKANGSLTSLAAPPSASSSSKSKNSSTASATPAPFPTERAAQELQAQQTRRVAKREQPWELLTGDFKPSGSCSSTVQVDEAWRRTLAAPSPANVSRSAMGDGESEERVESSQPLPTRSSSNNALYGHAAGSKGMPDPSTLTMEKNQQEYKKEAPVTAADMEASSPGKKRKKSGADADAEADVEAPTLKKGKKVKKEKEKKESKR
ncbi:hypothetical protein K437DRAFT_274298 [Tilletiaria anomala UBC 951]|uniref:Uncharacterized protein n=1 Tax=Tilletiaria anomala (strain ATCC 24038 / CBS 436.72 / UBC 951) TaxID=1037660 RepID=A0A066VY72_TILAU|nr:uncharacterized protein K437DRAFT_274298 [Tilletiaria anomala UBC 951]KDN45238.1 hypothetical protein K437DRAFT_274298 [Tilletiaria anomala UBC 951]